MAEPRTPVEEGQWRRGGVALVYAVLRASKRRKGFWICIDNEFPYRVVNLGRRELEAMPLAPRDYFGGHGHPGEKYAAAMEGMTSG